MQKFLGRLIIDVYLKCNNGTVVDALEVFDHLLACEWQTLRLGRVFG